MAEKTLLYVEDEKTDIMLLQLALKSVQIRNPLKTVPNGEAAMAYLKGDGAYADREQYPLPGLVLLDLNLPRRTGMQVLQ